MKKSLLSLLLAIACGCVHSPSRVSLPSHPSKEVFSSPAPTTIQDGEAVYTFDIEPELRRFIENDEKILSSDIGLGCLVESDTRRFIEAAFLAFDRTYIPEARDCDDLAFEFMVSLRSIYRRETEYVQVAPAVGFVGIRICNDVPEMGWHLHDGVALHALVIVRCAGGKWLLVDPGTRQISELTQHIYSGDVDLLLVIF